MQNGFIPTAQLEGILVQLKLLTTGSDVALLPRLKEALSVPGADIILWEEFWKVISVFIFSGDLEKALRGHSNSTTTSMTNFSNSANNTSAGNDGSFSNVNLLPPTLTRSDSDFARELAAEINGQGVRFEPTQVTEPTLHRSDSDLARALQAEFNNENNDLPAHEEEIFSDDRNNTVSAPITATHEAAVVVDPHSEKVSAVNIPQTEFAYSAISGNDVSSSNSSTTNSFDLFHYNGLIGASGRVPQLARSTLFLPTFDIIGQPVPLNDKSKSGGHGSPIDEVINSRWPDAVIQWHGVSNPPTID